MTDNLFSDASSLIEVLEKGQDRDFPEANHQKKKYIERFRELDRRFSELPVEMGAMKSEIDRWKNNLDKQIEEAAKIKNETDRIPKLRELLNVDTIVFLNKHGKEHINKVREKAFEILKCFTHNMPSCYEVFLILCSISVHDVGNFFGRVNHEKRIAGMLDSDCSQIIDDAVERRVIARIAGVHGGRIKGSKDTISLLKGTDTINNIEVREQLLAAVLRFADELADDNSRAIYPALDSGILGKASEIFHVYSSKLHTVKLLQNPVTKAWTVVLRYEIDEGTAKKQFYKGTDKVYLLDEIYERTLKMEQERRYCMRFLRAYCSIECINVGITIDNKESVFDQETIEYTLQEKGYPDSSFSTIKDVDKEIPTGLEMAQKLSV